jgi:hypothetical protein
MLQGVDLPPAAQPWSLPAGDGLSLVQVLHVQQAGRGAALPPSASVGLFFLVFFLWGGGCVFTSSTSVANPDPGSGMGKKTGSRSEIRIRDDNPDHISES